MYLIDSQAYVLVSACCVKLEPIRPQSCSQALQLIMSIASPNNLRRFLYQTLFICNQSNGNGSRNYPADTAKQRFIHEVYNKETAIRLGWYFNTRQADGSHLSTSLRQKEVNRKRIEDACPRPNSSLRGLRDRFQPAADYRKRTFNVDGRPVSGDWPTASVPLPPVDSLPDMKPADQETKERLYNGLSHDGKGRVDYLKTRSIANLIKLAKKAYLE